MNIQQLVDTINSLPPADRQKLLGMIASEQQNSSTEAPSSPSGFGWAKDLVVMAPDFDDPLTEFEDAGT